MAGGLATPDKLLGLQRLGCDAAQGFLIGKPRPATDLARDPAQSFAVALRAR